MSEDDFLAQLAIDLGPFADLGTVPPTLVESPVAKFLQLVRHGEQTQIAVSGSGLRERVAGNGEIRHASVKALLASERYAALKSWAAQQSLLLRQEVESVGSVIDQTGTINNSIDEVGIESVDDLLVADQEPNSTRVLLIDGPAGIGKTNFIVNLALRRSESVLSTQRPLILHVESRGRQLSYIYDLIAFSLQRLRSTVTFDQVPVLVRHGLVTIAIDGFDELADPNGYNLAWAQVNELVKTVRGQGSLILAGRETFIGRKRVQQDISELREGLDVVDSFTLTPPTPTRAKTWLLAQGATEDQLAKLEGFLERGSLALRPFFLKQLAKPELIGQLDKTTSGNALTFLIEAMIAREADKFGGEVDKALNQIERVQFVRNMMYEVARDMADNQTVAISETTLSWIVELALPKSVAQSAEFLLKNRAPSLGFLTIDTRPRHLRFYHEKFLEYFLARVVIRTICSREVPKFVVRNIFGTSFLETLGSVLEVSLADKEDVEFQQRALELLSSSTSFDRGTKNLAAFVLATIHLMSSEETIVIRDAEIDEARMVGTANPARLESCIISQLDVRDADLSSVDFDSTNVFTLIANEDTLVRDDSINPNRLVVVSGGEEVIESDKAAISNWLIRHSPNPPEEERRLLPAKMYDEPLVRLLGRAARIRQYWLRRSDDKYADRILNDKHWETLERLLENNGLLTKEKRDASGTDATFYHIRYPSEILSEDRTNDNVVSFYSDLRAELQQARCA